MIGVFDSGSGGLTVFRAIREALPGRNLVYLGDHARAPYGERSAEDIHDLTRDAVDRLFTIGCGLVVIACNTAAAVALRRLQQDWLPRAWPARRMLGVFVPMVETITGIPWNGYAEHVDRAAGPLSVGVFATPRTVWTCAWPEEIHRRAPKVRVVQQQCPGLAAMIEREAAGDEIDEAVGRYCRWLLARIDREPDAIVLGCTHYPLIADAFRRHLPARARIMDQPKSVADSLADYLARHPEFGDGGCDSGSTRFLTTGAAAAHDRVASRFLGADVSFERIAAARPAA